MYIAHTGGYSLFDYRSLLTPPIGRQILDSQGRKLFNLSVTVVVLTACCTTTERCWPLSGSSTSASEHACPAGLSLSPLWVSQISRPSSSERMAVFHDRSVILGQIPPFCSFECIQVHCIISIYDLAVAVLKVDGLTDAFAFLFGCSPLLRWLVSLRQWRFMMPADDPEPEATQCLSPPWAPREERSEQKIVHRKRLEMMTERKFLEAL